MTPAELRFYLDRALVKGSLDYQASMIEHTLGGTLALLLPELLRLWEAADDMDPRALPLTMPWQMADALDELEKIKP